MKRTHDRAVSAPRTLRFASRLSVSSCALAAALLLSGCCCFKPKPPKIDTGPTLTLRELAERVDQNNQAIPSLWAPIADFKAWVCDDKGREHYVSGDGTMVFRRPQDFLMRGNSIVGPVFEIGSTDERYWFTVAVKPVETMWHGSYANIGAVDPKRIPIRPDLVVDVLGVGLFGSDLTRLPAPVMHFDNELAVYKVIWTAPLPDRWIAQREVWYDRELNPKRVLLYDANGRAMLWADLSEPIDVAPSAAGGPPVRPRIASKYKLFFPETKTRLEFTLSDRAAVQSPHGVPKPGSVRFPEEPGVPKDRQIDLDRVEGK